MTDSAHAQPPQQPQEATADTAEKKGRRRKRRRQNNDVSEAAVEQVRRGEDEHAAAAEADDGDVSAAGAVDESPSVRRRYIVFVGNLPYRASVSDVEKLFSAMRPVGCRLPTDKQNRKPKGFAFVEFDDATAMRRALQLHHSVLGGRSINVELTAGGGGGKSEVRKDRIKQKNAALAKERKASRDKQHEVTGDSGRGSKQQHTGEAGEAGSEEMDKEKGEEEESDSSKRKSKRRRRKGKGSAAGEGEPAENGESDVQLTAM